MTDPLANVGETGLHRQLLRIRELFGQVVSSADLQREVKGFGSQRGIYKPRGSRHALWVRQTVKGVYPDEEPTYHTDGSWTYRYSPEGRGGRIDLSLDTNQALMRCRSDRVPVGVFRQTADVHRKAAYDVLGLAYVEKFDGEYFVLHGEPIDVTAAPILETVVPNFEPFRVESPDLTETLRIVRDRRFGVVVRRIYHEKCSLCNIGFRVGGRPIGLDAAHIIPVDQKGTIGDIRNGILLCKNHHALFDQFAWTMDEDLRVIVAPDKELRESAVDNHVLRIEGRRLPNLPRAVEDCPAKAAVDWRLRSFESTWA